MLGHETVIAETPNIILIMADDLGWGDVEYSQDLAPGNTYLGNQVLNTPNLQSMANAGVKFNRFYAASAACSPTRASFLTGRHARRHNIDGPLFLQNDGKIRNRDLTIAELAKMQGYTTGHFGKWHVGSITKHTYDMRRGREGNYRHYSAPWNNGYDTTFASENWMPTWDPYDNFPDMNAAQAAYFAGPSNAALTNRVPNDLRVDNRHESEIVADQAIDFIQNSHASGQPFMTTVWFATPHIPLIETPDTSYDGLGLTTDQRLYYESITAMDQQIGRIRQELTNLGIAEDTLLVFTSDNGPTDLSFGSTGGLSGLKGRLTEGGIRVPTVMEWEGRITPGSSTDAMATTSDILPTLMDIWGDVMPDDRSLDGESFLSVLDNGEQVRPDDYRFFSRHNNDRLAMDNIYKLFSSNSGASYQLYDLINDPTESINLLLGSPSQTILDKRDELVSGLNDWLAEVDVSRAGGDYSTRVAGSSNNVLLQEDIELALQFNQIGSDSFGAPVYEDKYQIVEGNTNFEDSNNASLFIERQYVTLDASLDVDTTGVAGTYDSTNVPTGEMVAAGEIIHSYLLHFDPEISSGQQIIQVDLEFEDEILGVIGRSDRLDDSDFLAFAEPGFDTGNDINSPGRGTLFAESSDGGWTINPDGRSITVGMQAGPAGIDQLRVITRAILPTILWSGDSTTTWDTAVGTDWDSDKNDIGDVPFASGDHVAFDDDASTFNVSILNPVSPASVTFRNSAGTPYTLSGAAITGTGQLAVKGGGTVTLSNAPNTYSGNTVIDSGRLSLAGSTTLASSPHIIVNAGGTLDVTGTTSGSYTLNNQALTIDGDVDGDIVASGTSTVNLNSENSLNGDLTLQTGALGMGLGRIAGDATAESGSVLRVGESGVLAGIAPMAPVTSSEDFQGFGTGTVFANNALTGSPTMPGWHFVDDAGSGEVTFTLEDESGDIVLRQTDPAFPEVLRGARAISPLQSDGVLDTITVQMRSDETGGNSDRVIYFAYEDDNNFSYAILRLNGTASFGDVDNGFNSANIPALNDFGSFSADFTEFVLTHNALTGQVTLSAGGVPLYDFADPRFVGGATGAVGIGTGNDAASFDDLVVITETPVMPFVSDLTIDGDYTQLMGAVLELDIYNPLRHDQLNIGGHFNAGGTLAVSLVADAPNPILGDMFDILDFQTSSGQFDDFDLPDLPTGLAWSTSDLLTSGLLEVVAEPSADFDGNGSIDGIDFLILQRNFGLTGQTNNTNGDANFDGTVNGADLSVWESQYGLSVTESTISRVPEPKSLALVVIGAIVALCREERGTVRVQRIKRNDLMVVLSRLKKIGETR